MGKPCALPVSQTPQSDAGSLTHHDSLGAGRSADGPHVAVVKTLT
ncbi:hypothetical protein [Erwinia sp.]|nr:hypothetical protein [Erwinia sp.]